MKQVNLGIIGFGIQGRIHFHNSLRLEKARIIGVADISKRARHYAKERGVPDVYANYEDLLKNKKIDAVIINLPNYLYHESVIKTAEAGKDIFLEKPMARNYEEGREIVSNVNKNNVRLMVGYNLRFVPVLIKTLDKINEGHYGTITLIEAANISGGPFFSRGDRAGPIPVPSWWFNKTLVGGGVLLDLGSHLIDLLTWYFGDVTEVQSYTGYMFNMDVEDNAVCMLKFKDGPIASLTVGWFSRDLSRSINLYGTAKNELINFSNSSTIGRIRTDIKKKLGGGNQNSYYSELKYFINCLLENQQPHPSGEEGLRTLQIISLAYKNASIFQNE